MKYSYVVIKRGARPQRRAQDIGRVGAIAKEEIASFRKKTAGDMQRLIVPVVGGKEGDYEVLTADEEQASEEVQWADSRLSKEEMQHELRAQAYQWPRLVYPPLKRSGHVIMDTCHPSGKSRGFSHLTRVSHLFLILSRLRCSTDCCEERYETDLP